MFGETLVFGRLLEAAADAGVARSSLLAESIEGSIATVFRQVAMNRFEHLVHTPGARRASWPCDDFGALWAESQEELLGDAVEVTEGYRTWWSYVPHFIATPGYVYAYAYGQLLALAVYAPLRGGGRRLRARLRRPAARRRVAQSPRSSAQIVGVDLADPGFWDKGLDLVERKLDAAEQAARDAGRDLARRRPRTIVRATVATSSMQTDSSTAWASSISRRADHHRRDAAGGEQAHVGAPRDAGERRLAGLGGERGAAPSAPTGRRGRVSPGANAPPSHVEHAARQPSSRASSRRVAVRARGSGPHRPARPGDPRSELVGDHARPFAGVDAADESGYGRRAHASAGADVALTAARARRTRRGR